MGKALILLIDPSAATRSMYADCFRHHGYDVVEAEDAAEGLRLFARFDPRLVVTELSDDPEWLDAIRMLRALVPGLHTPVILCSTRIDAFSPLAPEGIEADVALAKPVSPRALRTQADDLLRRHPPAEKPVWGTGTTAERAQDPAISAARLRDCPMSGPSRRGPA